jgi:hypothetical protein
MNTESATEQVKAAILEKSKSYSHLPRLERYTAVKPFVQDLQALWEAHGPQTYAAAIGELRREWNQTRASWETTIERFGPALHYYFGEGAGLGPAAQILVTFARGNEELNF